MNYTRTIVIKKGGSSATLVVLLLLLLKLTGAISIGWVWVLCPYWITFALILAVLLGFGLLGMFAILFAVVADKVIK
jgi:hypothetical protein